MRKQCVPGVSPPPSQTPGYEASRPEYQNHENQPAGFACQYSANILPMVLHAKLLLFPHFSISSSLISSFPVPAFKQTPCSLAGSVGCDPCLLWLISLVPRRFFAIRMKSLACETRGSSHSSLTWLIPETLSCDHLHDLLNVSEPPPTSVEMNLPVAAPLQERGRGY